MTWFSYCLHAALFSGLFALLVHCFLRRVGFPPWLSLLCAATSAVVYPRSLPTAPSPRAHLYRLAEEHHERFEQV